MCSNLRFHGVGLFSIIQKKRFIEENSKLSGSKKISSVAPCMHLIFGDTQPNILIILYRKKC